MRILVVLAAVGLALLILPRPANAPFRVSVAPAFATSGPGTDLDSIAIWEAGDPADTLMFVTAQANRLVEAWRFKPGGPELAFWLDASSSDDCLGGRYVNGVVVDQASDLLYVTVSHPSNRVCVFSVSEAGTALRSRIETGHDLKNEPNLGLLHLAGGRTRLYVSADSVVYPYDVTDLDDVQALPSFTPSRGLETLAGDDVLRRLYIPDEKGRTGIYAYDSDGRPDPGLRRFGAGVFAGDAEGIAIYACRDRRGRDNGKGFIVVSDQLDPVNEYEIFERRDGRFLGTLLIQGANRTDGVASTQTRLPGHPQGILAVVDADAATLGVGWAQVLAATGLRCPPP